jgi:quinol monooxygenase YgiN
MILVIASIEIEEGHREDFLKAFHRVVPLVRAEPGCLEYGPAIDLPTDIDSQLPPRGDVVTVVEKWESVEHLKAHLAAPHMATYRERVQRIVVRAVLQVLQPA